MPGRRRLLLAVVAAILLLGAAIPLLLLQRPSLPIALSLLAAVVGIFAVILNLLIFIGPRRAKRSSQTQLDDALRALAGQVQQYWQAEIRVRHLDDPVPLVVRWQLTEAPVMDQPGLITRRGRLRFTGRTDEAGAFSREFYNLDRKRLMILGGPGMGKTTLAALMLREFFPSTAELGNMVPVFLSMSDWNVDVENLAEWLERRLGENYPTLRAVEFGPTAVADLARSSTLLPILDGLDELSEAMRPWALKALNFAADRPLIVTSRTKAYGEAVASPQGHVLRAAAVVEAEPLRAWDIDVYLRRCLDRVDGSWPRLLSMLSREPMKEALATPLRLWLLRKVYIDANQDPSTVCDAATSEEIRDHLLDSLVKSLIETDRERKESGIEDDLGLETRHDWSPENAERWLAYLADFGIRHDSVNLKWWALYKDFETRIVWARVVLGVVAAAIFGLAFSPASALLAGCIGGLVFWNSERREAEPRYANLQLRGRLRRLPIKLWRAFRFTLLLGLAAFLVFSFLVDLRVAVEVGLSYAVVGGVMFTLSDTVATASVSDHRASTPRSTLRSDRVMTSIHVLAVGVTNAAALSFVLDLRAVLLIATTFALVGSVGTQVLVYLPRGKSFHIPLGFSAAGSAWANHLATKSTLATGRKLPWRLMGFLDDCYRLGLLRQEGASYQFRHEELRARLAVVYQRW